MLAMLADIAGEKKLSQSGVLCYCLAERTPGEACRLPLLSGRRFSALTIWSIREPGRNK